MLIDDTQPEETRVVIVNGNKVEDVEFESCSRKQIKGNIYTAKVIRVEPSLQAAFIDYGGNKHGFLAFGEIHPDYYNVSPELLETVEREADEIIERKKQYLKEREEHRERVRAEKKALYEARKLEEERLAAQAAAEQAQEIEQTATSSSEDVSLVAKEENATSCEQAITDVQSAPQATETDAKVVAQEEQAVEGSEDSAPAEKKSGRPKRKYTRRKKSAPSTEENATEEVKPEATEEVKTLAADTDMQDPRISEDQDIDTANADEDDETDVETVSDDDFDSDTDFELQRKLIRARKLYHYSTIQDVIKEGQTLLIQIVKEERGNKGAACTTYLSLAGRYCVLMPNRIKSGGVSRKITNAADRRRLKDIVKNLPMTGDMSLIIRTAGEEKTKTDIIRDYNYLIRAWNQIRLNALKNKAPCLIYEEGNLIKRALRDMYTKEISEVIVDGDSAFKAARDFVKILSPGNLKKIKCRKSGEMPVFQRFQIESQLDKLHNPVVQLESGGYLVINPTEALVSIDVNSGRATREKDIEETALKTNLEAADEIARQLKMRNLAGLIVVDFIDMDEPKNNIAVEKRMKEALKNDRSRIQIAKMSCFGLLEISRQRIHSSFMESNYQPCPHCHGQGVVRTTESGAMLILRALEEEGVKNRSSKITAYVPTDTAVYLLNQKRKMLTDLEQRYRTTIIIAADNEIKNICDYRLERTKCTKVTEPEQENVPATTYAEDFDNNETDVEETEYESDNNAEDMNNNFENGGRRGNRRFRGRRNRFDRYDRRRNYRETENSEKQSPVILFNSHQNNTSDKQTKSEEPKKEGKTAWWRKLIG